VLVSKDNDDGPEEPNTYVCTASVMQAAVLPVTSALLFLVLCVDLLRQSRMNAKRTDISH